MSASRDTPIMLLCAERGIHRLVGYLPWRDTSQSQHTRFAAMRHQLLVEHPYRLRRGTSICATKPYFVNCYEKIEISPN